MANNFLKSGMLNKGRLIRAQILITLFFCVGEHEFLPNTAEHQGRFKFDYS